MNHLTTYLSVSPEVRDALREKQPGDTITLVIVRDNQEMNVNVTLTGTIDTEQKQG